MKTARTFVRFALATTTLALAACNGGSGTSSSDPAERIGDVKSALEKPSGKVDAQSAPAIMEGFRSAQDLGGLSSLLRGVPVLNGSMSSSSDCVSGTDSGTIDLKCASDGAATGSASFTVTTKADSAGASSYVTVTFDKLCEGATCIDGSIAVGVEAGASGTSTTQDADLDITKDGQTAHSHVGITTSAGASGAKVDVIVFDEGGDSYVVETTAGAEGASIDMKGANGSFSCKVSGASGSCTGAASFSW